MTWRCMVTTRRHSKHPHREFMISRLTAPALAIAASGAQSPQSQFEESPFGFRLPALSRRRDSRIAREHPVKCLLFIAQCAILCAKRSRMEGSNAVPRRCTQTVHHCAGAVVLRE